MHITTSRKSRARAGFRSAIMILAATTCGFGFALSAEAQAQKLTAEQLLKAYKPAQKDVEFDTPDAAEMAKCTLTLEKTGYVITNPAGQVLRRFTDSNGDTAPDMFRYYHMGLEVYREVDTNGDAKTKKNVRPDQYRWMNWGGTRLGMDEDEDGRIELRCNPTLVLEQRAALAAIDRGIWPSLGDGVLSPLVGVHVHQICDTAMACFRHHVLGHRGGKHEDSLQRRISQHVVYPPAHVRAAVIGQGQRLARDKPGQAFHLCP